MLIQQFLITKPEVGKDNQLPNLKESFLKDNLQHSIKKKKEDLFIEIASFRDEVYGKAYRYLSNQMDADDITQEVMERAFLNYETYNPEFPMGGWLMGILKLEIRQMKRTLNLHEQIIAHRKSEKIDMDSYITKEEEPFADMDIQQIVSELGSEKFTKILKLRMEGYSYKEIAVELGIGADLARLEMNNGKKKIRRKFVKIKAYCYV